MLLSLRGLNFLSRLESLLRMRKERNTVAKLKPFVQPKRTEDFEKKDGDLRFTSIGIYKGCHHFQLQEVIFLDKGYIIKH